MFRRQSFHTIEPNVLVGIVGMGDYQLHINAVR
jgi:hypothetical protein